MYCYHCMTEIKEEVKFCPACGKSPGVSNAAHQLPCGTVLNGKYVVGKAIGEGGFGITYVGKDDVLKLKVAIKEFFPSGYAGRDNKKTSEVTLNYKDNEKLYKKSINNFLSEARNLAMFSKEKGIVNVREYFEENNTAYIVMDFLEGETLAQSVKKHGPFVAEEFFEMIMPVANTLEKMHRRGIIHRDVSPDNIMISGDELTLMDFGAARFYSADEEKTAEVILKRGYAPIEQYTKGGKQGPYTDIYGLCATIYKCITGVTPTESVERRQNDNMWYPSENGADIEEDLERLLMKGLEVFPENRFRSMGQFIAMYKRLTEEDVYAPGVEYDEPNEDKKSNKLIIIGCIILCVIIVAGVVLFITGKDKLPFFSDNGEAIEENMAKEEIFTRVDCSSALKANDPNENYGPYNCIDGISKTAWNEGEAGNGVGTWIKLSAEETHKVRGIKILSGYNKDEETYHNNCRPEKIHIEFSDDDVSADVKLDDKFGSIQEIGFEDDAVVETDFVKLTIESVYVGDKYNDCCISEISVICEDE